MLQDYTRPTDTVQPKTAWSPHGSEIPMRRARELTAIKWAAAQAVKHQNRPRCQCATDTNTAGHDETEHSQHGTASRLHLWRTVTAIRHIGSTRRARPVNGRATARHSHGCIANEIVRPCSLCEDIAAVEQDCRTTYRVCTAEEAIRRSYPGAEIY